MRLKKSFGVLAATAMAFALFTANARAASVGVVASGQTKPYTVTVGPFFVISPVECVGEGMDICGHVTFTAGATGTATITGTFGALNEADLVLCGPLDPLAEAANPLDRCANGTEVVCGKTEIVNPSANTVTVTLSCPVTAGTTYELVVAPLACDIFSETCTFDVTGTIGINTAGGTGTGTGGTSFQGSVTGGGKINFGDQTFSITAFTDAAKSDQGHALVQNPGKNGGPKCQIRATSFQTVVLKTDPSNPNNGQATVNGTGYLNGNGNTIVHFQAGITDGGEGSSGSGDTFQLTSDDHPECNTGDPHVVHGNTQVKPNV